jgi:hypothetical protein
MLIAENVMYESLLKVAVDIIFNIKIWNAVPYQTLGQEGNFCILIFVFVFYYQPHGYQ